MKFLGKIKCLLGYHDTVAVQRLSPFAYKIDCKRCRKAFAVKDPEGWALPWGPKFESFYRDAFGIKEFKWWDGSNHI